MKPAAQSGVINTTRFSPTSFALRTQHAVHTKRMPERSSLTHSVLELLEEEVMKSIASGTGS